MNNGLQPAGAYLEQLLKNLGKKETNNQQRSGGSNERQLDHAALSDDDRVEPVAEEEAE